MCKVRIGDSIMYGFPTTLYHYCSMQSFMSIVANHTIRLSDITKSNDKMEVKAFYDLVHALAMKFLTDIEEQRDEAYHEISSYRKKLSSALNADLSFLYFVFCMSTDPDVANQWQGYSEDGTGIAIGFNTECLRELFVHTHANIFWNATDSAAPFITYFEPDDIVSPVEKAKRKDNVEYYLNEVVYSIEQAINEFEETIKELRSKYFNRLNKTDNVDELLLAFHEAIEVTIQKYSVNVKDKGFRYEKEFRLSIMGASAIKGIDNPEAQLKYHTELLKPTRTDLEGYLRKPLGFRLSGTQIVGFIDVDFSMCRSSIIEQIRLGPECNSSERDIAIFLEANGYGSSEIAIKRALTPYRKRR